MSQVVDILKSVKAIITDDHFVLTSGGHANIYINKDELYVHTKETSEVCRLMAEAVKDLEIDTVVGPALGGIILSQWVAFHLSQIKDKEIYGVYTEKTSQKGQIFTRGYDKFVKGKKVLVVEDLTSTGASVKKAVESIKKEGGGVTGVVVMVNRNPREVNSELFGVPFFALDVLEVKAYGVGECPMCKQGVPVNISLGHGKKFLEQQKNG